MAGHSKFKNIMHRKGAQDKKRGKIFTKLIKEITIAVKMGSADMDSNPRLRSAIAEAKANNMPKDNIDRAIKKGQNNQDGENYEEIRYEGYAAGGVAVIVEAITDNRNRTASEVRSLFTKMGGNLGESGSVNFMFDRFGFIAFSKVQMPFDKIFEIVIEEGAQDVLEEDNGIIVLTKIEDLHLLSNILSTKLMCESSSSYIGWQPKIEIKIEDEQHATSILKLIAALEDLDDVQKVFTNFDMDIELIERVS